MAQSVATYINSPERRGMAYSFAMHVLLLLIFIVGMPSFMQPDTPDEPTAISVEILPIGAKSNVRPSKSKPIKKEKKEDKPKPSEIIEKTLEDLKEEKAKPSPAVKTKDDKPTPPAVVDDTEGEKLEDVLVKEPEDEKKPEEDPLDAILKGVKDTAAQDKKQVSTSQSTDSSSKSKSRSNQFDPNSPEALSIRDAINSQVYRCWSPPIGARDAENLRFEIEVNYNKQGSPISVEIPSAIMSRYRSDSYFRSAVDSAVRAVRRCSPLQLPAENYVIWEYVDINFDPSQMLR